MSTSATADCRAALAHAKAGLLAAVEALFARLDAEVARQDPRLTFAAMASRHPAIELSIEAVARQTAEIVHALVELGTDVLDDRRPDLAARLLDARRTLYAGVFEEVESDAEREAFERGRGFGEGAD